MEEIRWPHGMEEYRAVQELVRAGRYRDAAGRAREALLGGRLGRRYAARLNSLLCWLYATALQEPSPVAVLHGEEAVRLAELCNDEWIRCEAYVRLVPAYCHLGDLYRAERSCEALASELNRNQLVVPGGWSALWHLRALVATAGGNLERARQCLDEAEAEAASGSDSEELLGHIRGHRGVIAALDPHSPINRAKAEQAAETAFLEGDGDRAVRVRAAAVAALRAESQGDSTAPARAREALCRAIASGRADLVLLVRRRLAHLLES